MKILLPASNELKIVVTVFYLISCIHFLPAMPVGQGNQCAYVSTLTWEGTYTGTIEGVEAVLSIRSEGSNLVGNVDVDGYKYSLNGSVNQSSWTGSVTDLQSGVVLPFRAVKNSDRIDITIEGIDPQTGEKGTMTYSFKRGEPAAPKKDDTAGQIDERLIGRWTYSESYGSGQFTGVAQWQMQLNADGTFWYGKGQFAGGGPGVSGSSSSDDVSRGQWKVQGKDIYVNEGDGWYRYAKYYVEGNDLMFTFDEDTREVWSR